ncbi:zinc finger protein 260-like [Copidosoma floridanum]|uniref:zinc finger protein 260-like n=1 Tax=Copidosoma floridanum TaxID=29053 RepID=UPI0006C9733C|nr:zinc finger protein 260-like [Copidosoma floridanum]
MEVTTEEEAQAVLLESMEGTQYITIQRADGESLGKGVPLFTLSGELLSEGMVVDMINGVNQDYNAGTQYYETDDLLPHELTEEDRRLAAALVAVQLQQQQKQQQLHSHPAPDDTTLESVAQLESLPTVNSYTIETLQEPNPPPPVYPVMQTFKREMQSVKQEFINVKCEDDVDISAESSEDAVPAPGPKRSLPHKKRIPRKLKRQSKKNSVKKDSAKANSDVSADSKTQGSGFKCELCGNKFNGQLKFFEHLKSHYEPVKEEKKFFNNPVNNNLTITMPKIPESRVPRVENTIEEFSEPEDIMEGIRDVVEETGAQIDDDEDDDINENSLQDSSNGPSIWTMSSDVFQQVEQGDSEISTINKEDLVENEKPKPPDPVKKKKAKPKKPVSELTCPNCDRTFQHKNSLVYHMRSHSGERPHQCEICGKRFYAASALKVHKRLHSGDKPYKCEDCGRHFRQWGDLKYHSTSLHSEQRQFQCEYCGKDFARKYSLIVHRRIHTGEKNYRCEYCNKTFRASSYLQNHRRIHTGEKPHPCDVCAKPFRVRSDMKRHMLTHSRTKNRTKRPKAKGTTKNQTTETENSSEDDGKTIELVAADQDSSESILPHVSYSTVNEAQAQSNDRDPLSTEVVRNADTLNFDMQLYTINL